MRFLDAFETDDTSCSDNRQGSCGRCFMCLVTHVYQYNDFYVSCENIQSSNKSQKSDMKAMIISAMQ